jgi:hypothetical protein
MELKLAGSFPGRFSLIYPCPRTRLLERSSRGVRSSFTAFPEISVQDLSVEDDSHGICCPFSAYRQRESTSFRLTGRPPERDPKASSSLHQQVPICRLRCRSQVFSTSQRPCSSHCHPAIFRQVALLGLHPPGIFSSHEASDNSSLPDYPLDVAPSGRAAPVLGWNAVRHMVRVLG